MDILKARREGMRWHLLNALDKARPLGAIDTLLLDVVRCIYPDATPKELHTQLDYLDGLNLVEISKYPTGHWHGCLSSIGVDVVEYTADCHAGIARPEKYWG
ncbi:hypothetical protein [Psychrobacter pygoscelis]|uniref:hypothetical protein n=1 Tax=Psychrobacter pygoscelis TaxID=2488563 RepID=UPI001039A323|nr:hypothetical protein [Psychrobacter pygoscelis]